MATLLKLDVPPTLIVHAVDLDAGEIVTFDLTYKTNPPVMWENGGVSWTVKPTTEGGSFNCKVEHSLMPKGYDQPKYWTEDEDSPYTSEVEGNEHFRVQRVRFTATTGNITVVLSTNTRNEVQVS